MPDREWLARYRPILVVSGAALAVVVALSFIDHGCNFTGFGSCATPENTRPEKTLWDWLQLLIVPAVLAVVGLWYSSMQKRTELEIADQQKRTELEIADQRSQDSILQTYLDQMAELLLTHDPWQESSKAILVRNMAKVRTLTALRRLDESRRDVLLRSLRDAGLLIKDANRSTIDLRGASFSDADLSGNGFDQLDLEGASFYKGKLQKAFFYEAKLHRVLFAQAQLQEAVFYGAQLQEAIFDNAQLQGADLCGAQLQEASFERAQLDNADLRETDITADQLAQAASYKGAKLPDHLLHLVPSPSTHTR